MKLRSITTIAILLPAAAGIARAQDERPAKRATTSDVLQAEIEALMPAKIAWREIQWKTCLLEGLKESREKKKSECCQSYHAPPNSRFQRTALRDPPLNRSVSLSNQLMTKPTART